MPKRIHPASRRKTMSMQKVREIVESTMIGYLATSVDGQPRVRPLSFMLREDGKLWSSTYRQSGKIAEFEQNPKVEICFMDSGYVQLRIAGTVDLTGGADKKKELLRINPKVKNHFPDENDPKYVHIEITPTSIRYKATGFGEYTEVPI
jgi:uncharacterized pyridoxamine 5'-phosphate oxidase family protein